MVKQVDHCFCVNLTCKIKTHILNNVLTYLIKKELKLNSFKIEQTSLGPVVHSHTMDRSLHSAIKAY